MRKFVQLIAIGALGAVALSACGGGTSSTSTTTTTTQAASAAPSVAPPATSVAQGGSAAAGNAAHGKTLYMANCSSCHGAKGEGSIGPTLKNEKSRKNLAQAIAWIKNPKAPMPALFPGTLSETDVRDVATYIESL